jgi:hypothetical protein
MTAVRRVALASYLQLPRSTVSNVFYPHCNLNKIPVIRNCRFHQLFQFIWSRQTRHFFVTIPVSYAKHCKLPLRLVMELELVKVKIYISRYRELALYSVNFITLDVHILNLNITTVNGRLWHICFIYSSAYWLD